MKIGKEGFTLVEMVAAVAIIGIFLGVTLWNIPSLRQEAKQQAAIHKAMLVSTAKEVFLRENGIYGLQEYSNRHSESERFDLVKAYIPYISVQTSIKDYMPKNYFISMSDPGLKVRLFKKNNKEEIYY